MRKKQSVSSRQYTDEFKVEVVRLAGSIGGNPAAKRLDIPESSLWNWIKLSRAGKLAAAQAGTVPVKRSVGASLSRTTATLGIHKTPRKIAGHFNA